MTLDLNPIPCGIYIERERVREICYFATGRKEHEEDSAFPVPSSSEIDRPRRCTVPASIRKFKTHARFGGGELRSRARARPGELPDSEIGTLPNSRGIRVESEDTQRKYGKSLDTSVSGEDWVERRRTEQKASRRRRSGLANTSPGPRASHVPGHVRIQLLISRATGAGAHRCTIADSAVISGCERGKAVRGSSSKIVVILPGITLAC